MDAVKAWTVQQAREGGAQRPSLRRVPARGGDCVERMMAFCPMPTAGPDPAPAPAPCAPSAHDLATRLQPGPRARGNIIQFNNLIHTSGHRESAQESTLDGGDHEGPEGGRRNVARYSLH